MSATQRPGQPQLWIIDCGNSNRWCDNRGGFLFVSHMMAYQTYVKYASALERIGAKITLAGLDEDLCQMSDLYHEGAKK